MCEADLDKQLDNAEADELAEEELSDVNNDGNMSEDLERENKEEEGEVEEQQQTDEVSTIITCWMWLSFVNLYFLRATPQPSFICSV